MLACLQAVSLGVDARSLLRQMLAEVSKELHQSLHQSLCEHHADASSSSREVYLVCSKQFAYHILLLSTLTGQRLKSEHTGTDAASLTYGCC